MQKNINEMMENMQQLDAETPDATSTASSNPPTESAAHKKLREEVSPLLEKIHKECNELFCQAYEKHDLAKAKKLHKLLEQMLVLVRSSE